MEQLYTDRSSPGPPVGVLFTTGVGACCANRASSCCSCCSSSLMESAGRLSQTVPLPGVDTGVQNTFLRSQAGTRTQYCTDAHTVCMQVANWQMDTCVLMALQLVQTPSVSPSCSSLKARHPHACLSAARAPLSGRGAAAHLEDYSRCHTRNDSQSLEGSKVMMGAQGLCIMAEPWWQELWAPTHLLAVQDWVSHPPLVWRAPSLESVRRPARMLCAAVGGVQGVEGGPWGLLSMVAGGEEGGAHQALWAMWEQPGPGGVEVEPCSGLQGAGVAGEPAVCLQVLRVPQAWLPAGEALLVWGRPTSSSQSSAQVLATAAGRVWASMACMQALAKCLRMARDAGQHCASQALRLSPLI